MRFIFDRNTWQEIFGSISKNKTRTIITVIGVLWGIFIYIALFVIVLDLMQFIGWATPSCVCINIVLDGIITRLQCSMLYITIAMNTVPLCAIPSVLSLKWHFSIVNDFLVELF